MSKVTVIVPTRNEAHNIPSFLASLPNNIPLIVVDASDDNTPEIINRQRPTNTLLLRHPGMVTEARQTGAKLCQTEWLLFTDADVLFADDYFQKLPSYLISDALYGAKLSQTAFQSYYRWFTRGQKLAHSLGIPAASGSNLLIHRQVFQAIGGFDLRLTCNEDSEIAWRIKQKGYTIHFQPELIVYARDHRRLHQGQTRKTVHSLLRCALIFSGMMPERWLKNDWGYWKKRQMETKAHLTTSKE